MKNPAWLVVLAVAGAFAIQEPEKAKQQPQEPVKVAEGEKSKVVGAPKRDPLEGLYELRGRVVNGVQAPGRGRGYVSITHTHLLMVLAGAGSNADRPLLRAGVRKWKRSKKKGDKGVEMVAEIGFFTNVDGDIFLEKPGSKSVRRIDLARGRLRIWQDMRSYLEFERIE